MWRTGRLAVAGRLAELGRLADKGTIICLPGRQRSLPALLISHYGSDESEDAVSVESRDTWPSLARCGALLIIDCPAPDAEVTTPTHCIAAGCGTLLEGVQLTRQSRRGDDLEALNVLR